MRLVYESNGEAVKIGDEVELHGETFKVKGIRKPHKPSSTGRVYVWNEMYDAEQEYFPGVIKAKWIEREDQPWNQKSWRQRLDELPRIDPEGNFSKGFHLHLP